MFKLDDGGMIMHTPITLDDQLVQPAIELTGLKNPQALIETLWKPYMYKRCSYRALDW